MYEDELMHYGVLGMKWGRRKSRSSSTSKSKRSKSLSKNLSRRQVKKQNSKAIKEGRIIDDGNDNVIGVKQKNGDILFVDRKQYLTRGVDYAESMTYKLIKEATANRKKLKQAKKFVDKEQKALADELLSTYDKNDPDAKEAMEILRDIKNSN